MEFVTHRREDGTFQPLKEHIENVGERAAQFAAAFGAEEHGREAGLLHDIGKYSSKGQKRQRDPEHTAKVDHSSAGAQEAFRRKDPMAAFAVAGSFAAPVAYGWADVLLNIFSPMAREEFLRVLAPGGALVYAVPGPRHLFGLKQVLYDTPYENPCRPVEYPGFVREAERAVQGTIRLEGGAIQDLFAMTPYYWKTPKEGAERLAKLEVLQTEIEFRFVIYRKQG